MRRAAFIALLVLLAGCPDAEKEEAKSVAAAIDDMRTKRGHLQRTPPLEALETRQIEGEQARQARDACVAAYRPLVEAQSKIAAAKELKDDTSGQVKALSGSTEMLKTSQEKMPDCIEELRKLKQLAGMM